MKITRNLLGGAAALLLVPSVLAHHVDTALSYIDGHNVLASVTHYRLGSAQDVGFPGILLNGTEHHPGTRWALSDGASFQVSDAHGASQTVTFHAADFIDIGSATVDEILNAANAQLTLARLEAQNSFFNVQGTVGGPASSVTVSEGAQGALGVLGFAPATVLGREDLTLDLSIPADHGHGHEAAHHDLAHNPYVLLMSTTDTSFQIGEHTVPLGRDLAMRRGLRLISNGVLPTFAANLDATADAQATFDMSLVDLAFPTSPSEIYFAYIVFSKDHAQVEFVSNRFTLRLQ
jgi:hypothetical protein